MRWHIGESLLYFINFRKAKSSCIRFIILFEIFYLFKILIIPTNYFLLFRRLIFSSLTCFRVEPDITLEHLILIAHILIIGGHFLSAPFIRDISWKVLWILSRSLSKKTCSLNEIGHFRVFLLCRNLVWLTLCVHFLKL